MTDMIDVLAHTWSGLALLGLACVGGVAIAASFAFITDVVARKLGLDVPEPTTPPAIVLPFDPSSVDLYAFRSELRPGAPVIPFHPRESVH